MTVTERIIEVMQKKGLTQVALANAIGYTKSTVNYNFQNNKSFDADVVMAISKFLNVSIQWLLTGEEIEELPTTFQPAQEPALTEDEKELLEIFRSLNREGKVNLLYQAYQQRAAFRDSSEEQGAAIHSA